MFRYLVIFGDKKKGININNKTTLYDAIGQRFGIDASLYSIKWWDNEFSEWVDLDDFADLPNKCKLQVLEKGERNQCLLHTYMGT